MSQTSPIFCSTGVSLSESRAAPGFKVCVTLIKHDNTRVCSRVYYNLDLTAVVMGRSGGGTMPVRFRDRLSTPRYRLRSTLVPRPRHINPSPA